MNLPNDVDAARFDRLVRLFADVCDEAHLGSTCAYFRAAEVLDGTLYVDVDFDCDTTEFDEKHRKLIDDLLVIARRGIDGPAIITARSCPKYFGDRDS